MENKKRNLELAALDSATDLLKRIYGIFEINPSQVDKPDAEIKITKPKKIKYGTTPFSVGVEITTVDPQDYLEYFNETKHSKAIIEEKTMQAIESQQNIGQSSKYMSTKVPADFISSQATRKSGKYSGYMNAGGYREVALICFSEMLSTKDRIFNGGLKQWTDYYLSSEGFPFDVVIFVDLRSRDAVRIYDKKRPLLVPPPAYAYPDATIERSNFFLLAGQPGEFMNKNPLVSPRTKRVN